MIKFIFFGRLVEEKGIGVILKAFSELYLDGFTNRHLDIYGVGPYDHACEGLSKALPTNVKFHGRGEHATVIDKIKDKDYCLMPSLVIETFGLSALESIRQGTPVIGFKKGGLEPFITDELAISNQAGNNNEEKLYSLLHDIVSLEKNKHDFPLAPREFNLDTYSTRVRLDHFSQIAGEARRILIVSDFVKKVGGVENYIHQVKGLLEQNGYEVKLFGSNKKNSFRGLFKTAFNIPAWRKLRKVISAFQPDITWCHSVMRELGRLPLAAIPKNTKTRMMFHDMGYFDPFPSRTYDIPGGNINTLKTWINLGRKKNKKMIPLILLKRLSLCALRSIFHHRNTTYLVPSVFMQPLVEKRRTRKDQKTTTLSHFVK